MIAGKPCAATSFFTSPLLEPLQQSPDHIFNAAQPIAADLGARRVTASDVDCICAFADRFDHRVAKAVDHIGVVADAAVAPRGGTGQVKSIDTAAMATIYTSAAETTLNSFSLAAINNVENLTFTGVGDFTGTGNTLANTITGGGGNDRFVAAIGVAISKSSSLSLRRLLPPSQWWRSSPRCVARHAQYICP